MAAPEIRWLASASKSADSTTMGPRDVFTSRAEGFINAISVAPINPFVRRLNIMWIETTSAVRSSSSFDTRRAPALSFAEKHGHTEVVRLLKGMEGGG